jgi:hypothetical protein
VVSGAQLVKSGAMLRSTRARPASSPSNRIFCATPCSTGCGRIFPLVPPPILRAC